MIYKRIIDLGDNKLFGLDVSNNFVLLKNIDINNCLDLKTLSHNKVFYGYLIDLLILYKSNEYIKYNYFIIDSFNYFFIFNYKLLIDFLLKYINIDKNRNLYIDILFSDVKNYYILNDDISIFNEFDIDNLINKIGRKNLFIKISKLNGDIKTSILNHKLYSDKHLLNFENYYLYKYNDNKINIKNISKLVDDFGFINYISHYKIDDSNIDLFLLTPVNIDGLKYKPLIVKGMDGNNILSIIKGFAEGIERYSSLKLLNDCLYKTSNINHLKIFSNDFLGYNIYENEYVKKTNGFPVYKIKNISNNKITLHKNCKLNIPIDFLFTSLEDKSINKFIGNSNGISTHSNYYDAFLNSYYEILERDSIALTYYYKLSPNIIEIDNYHYKNKLENLEKKYNYNFSFLNLNFNHGINIILCIGKNIKDDIPYIFVGAGADINYIKAFEKSLNEAIYLIDISNKNNLKDILNKKSESLLNLDIFDTKDHIYYYGLIESYVNIKYLFLNKKKVKFSNFINYKNKDLIKNIKNNTLYISNLTTSFGKKNNIYTIKLFSDKYVPFWFGKNSIVPISKLENRFHELKEYLTRENIFNENVYKNYFSEDKKFLHFLG